MIPPRKIRLTADTDLEIFNQLSLEEYIENQTRKSKSKKMIPPRMSELFDQLNQTRDQQMNHKHPSKN